MSTRVRRCTAILLIPGLALALAGCASPGTSRPAFPVGSYQSGDLVIVFRADGTALGTTPQGQDWNRSTYTVDGDLIRITDTWMAEALADRSCVGRGAGVYRWALQGRDLTVTLVEDACTPRAGGAPGTWRRID